MATIDQPTPPNLGNQSAATFLGLPDWSVPATNQTGDNGEQLPDTFAAMQSCVVALLYRLIRDNFAYENEAWACRVSTPISEKIAELQNELQARSTDNGGQALTATLLTAFAVPLPSQLFNCDGDLSDDIDGDNLLQCVGPGIPAVFHVVSANGSDGTLGSTLLGLKASKNRYYFGINRTTPTYHENVIASCNVTIDWQQDSSPDAKVVLLKVADYLTTDETGAAKRMQFEFGIGKASDLTAHGTDSVLFLRYYDSSDVESRTVPFASSGFIGLGYGREITVGFSRLENGGLYDVAFYINGIQVDLIEGRPVPSVGTDLGIRLHVGSNQLGNDPAGGPVNNVYYWGSATTKTQAEVDGIMNSVYRIGAGYLST